MVAVFYANDGIITLPKPARTQLALNVLTGLFDRVGLQTNVSNMVGMVCQPCYIFGIHLEAAYTRRMMGVCPYFWEWQRERFRCPECELELTAGSLAAHHQAQHRKDIPPQWVTPTATTYHRIYRLYLPKTDGSIVC